MSSELKLEHRCPEPARLTVAIGATHVGQQMQFSVFINVCRANALEFFFRDEPYLDHYS